MALVHRSLVLVASLALGVTAAFAAPGGTAPVVPGSPSGPCPEPSADKCLSMIKVSGQQELPYLETACGITKRESCRQVVADALEVHGTASAADTSLPTLEMLRPKRTEMPLHLRDGKYFKYAPTQVVLTANRLEQRKKYKKVDDLLEGYGGMSAAASPPVARGVTVNPKNAIKFWRNESWRDNGPAIHSCKEYAYARSFGAARFIDAASACRGDRECVFDVAYSAAPQGITGDNLLNEAKGVMAKQLYKPGGVFQKNEMFAADWGFVRSNGLRRLEATPEITRLETALKDGRHWYEIGMCEGADCDDKRKFKDVWAFHKKLHGVAAAVSPAEQEEYERRLTEFRNLLDQWHAAVLAERPDRRELPTLEKQLVLPLEMRARDPFLRYKLENEYIERGREQSQLLEKRFGKQISAKSAEEAMQQIRSGKQQQGSRSAAPAFGVLAMAPTGAASKPDYTVNGWGLETFYKGPISKKIGAFLREEWARREAGHRSCLDPDKQRCDWTMGMFEQGILTQLPVLDAQVADEEFCEDYLDTDTFSNTPRTPTVSEVYNRLMEARRIRMETLAEVADYLLDDGTHGQALGSSWTGGDYAGDKESFGAGYDYDVGWRVEPAKKVASDAQTNAGLVCQMKGNVHAEMSFDAHLVGKKFPIVSGSVHVRSQPNDSGNAEYTAHLRLLDVSLYEDKSTKFKGTQKFDKGEEKSQRGKQIPAVKPRFDVMVGPVPVSGQVWGELSFGSSLAVGGTAARSNQCDPSSMSFGVEGGYQPYFRAAGVGQVGVGISGLVSAGIRAALTLVQLSTPISFGAGMKMKDGKPNVSFDADVDLLLSTLGGRVSLYLEFLLYEEEFELFRWRGIATDLSLLSLSTDVPVQVLK